MATKTAVSAVAAATETPVSGPALLPVPSTPPLAVEPEGGWPPDQYTGVGGSYVRDPYTGIRRPSDPEPDEPAAPVQTH